MKKVFLWFSAVAVFLLCSSNIAFSYTALLKNGNRVEGMFIGETNKVISIRATGGIVYTLKKSILNLEQMALLNQPPKPIQIRTEQTRSYQHRSAGPIRSISKIPNLVKQYQRRNTQRGHVYTKTDLEQRYGPLSTPLPASTSYLYSPPQSTFSSAQRGSSTLELDINWLRNQSVEPARAICLAKLMHSLPSDDEFCGVELGLANDHQFNKSNSYLFDDPVSVTGYFRSDGTYVKPHLRTKPDGIPENNFNFPGNYNPNTGQITLGDRDKYLDRYYGQKGYKQPSIGANIIIESDDDESFAYPQNTRQDLIGRRYEGKRPDIDLKSGTEICSEMYKADGAARSQCMMYIRYGTLPQK